MPLYEYGCAACGARREVLVRSSEAAAQPPRCPGCGAPMEKRIAPVAAHTKSGAAGCGAPRASFA